MTAGEVAVIGGAVVGRDDARQTPWRDVRLGKLASPAARMLVEATMSAVGGRVLDDAGRVGVYVASGETGLDVTAFLPAAHVAWDEHPHDPDYGHLGGRALRAIDPYYSLRSLANGPASLLAMQLGATGPSLNLAHHPMGAAWALLAALDDLATHRCGLAVIGACDVPDIPTRRALARLRQQPVPRDRAAVLVLGPCGLADASSVRVGIQWASASSGEPQGGYDADVVAPLGAIVQAGAANAWRSACEARISTPAGRVCLTVAPAAL